MASLGDPSWDQLVQGMTVDLVVKASSDGMLISTWHGGVVNCEGLQPGPWSLFGYEVVAVQGQVLTIKATQDSCALPKPALGLSSFQCIKETCSGIGGISVGIAHAGGHTVLFSERADIACRTLELNQGVVVEGDIASPEIRARIARHQAGSGCTLVAGFPCQPYSRQGAGGGLADQRGHTLLHTLQLARQTQADCIILECVSEVQQYPAAMEVLHDFARRTGFQFSEVVLELGDQWASRRRRWWGVFVPAHLPSLSLLPWPVVSPPVVIGDILPEWPTWPIEHEQELAWTALEQAMYQDERFGKEPRAFDQCQQAPTALHSWGSALRPCPCKCRASGFSRQSLEQRGLRGIGVFSAALQGFRFPHPAEVGFLNSLPPEFLHLKDMRAALCLVGQIAAPMQALWVYAQVRRWAEQVFIGNSSVDPSRLLQSYKDKLLRSRKDLWRVPSLEVPGLLWLRKEGVPCPVQIVQPVQVKELAAAELALEGPGHKAQVLDGARRLPPCAFLQPNRPDCPYEVCIQAKKARVVPCPTSKPCDNSNTSFQELGASDVAIWAGLMRLQGVNLDRQVFVLTPDWTISLLQSDIGGTQACPAVAWPQDAAVCTLPVLDQGHWSLLLVTKGSSGFIGQHFDGIPGRSQQAARLLLSKLACLFGSPVAGFESTAFWVQTNHHSCGVLLLAHFAAFLLGGPSEAILADAAGFLACFPRHAGVYYGQGGLSDAQQQALRKILVERGVPETQVADRVQAAVTKIGAGPIAQAFAAANPWQALKAAGSSPNTAFRWIKPEELKAHAEAKAAQKFGAAVAQPKSKKSQRPTKGGRPQLQVDPQALLLSPRSFTTEGGEPLAQLGFSEVVPQAQGISFCTAQQLLPFIQTYQSLSVDALALVATSEIPADLCAGAPVTSIRFPAIYEPTGEAILLQGSLLQLGDETVQLAATDIADVEVDVVTGRASLFRDEATISWETVAQAPIKALLQYVPALNLCRDSACKGNCQLFHPAVDESVEHIFLDVWARRFSTVDGSRVDAGKADLFQALVRVPSSALKHLQRANTPGYYFEPRSGDGYNAHAGFSVIWLPGKDRVQALHIAQTTDKVVAITRINRRFGVRVREADEPATHRLLRPEVDFVKVRIAATYRLHPLPHGMQRKHLVALLKQWHWAARPLQVLKGDAAGSAWEVGSDVAPPGQALAAAGSYVLISKLRDASAQHRLSSVTAPPRTKKLLYDDPEVRVDPNAGKVDPWFGGRDPWSQCRPPPGLPNPPAPSSASTADSKLQQVRGELQETFRKQFEEFTTAQAGQANVKQEQRLQKLEVSMTELQEQNRRFQDWCQTIGTQIGTHSNQIGEVQRTVQAQQAEVGQLRTEFTQVLATSNSNLQQDISRQLSAQMQQIESLLSKKPRTE